MPDGTCVHSDGSDAATALRAARGVAYILTSVTSIKYDPQSHEIPLHAPLPIAGCRTRPAMPSPCPFALGDVATPRPLCVRHMLRPLLAAPAYNGARRRVIFQTFESCMTDPANRRRSLGLPWIHRRSYSKSQGWPRSSGRRKKCDGRAAHHTSRVAQRRSCELGACEQRWSMTEGTFGMAVATCAYVAPSDRTTIHGRGLAISGIYIVHLIAAGPGVARLGTSVNMRPADAKSRRLRRRPSTSARRRVVVCAGADVSQCADVFG